MGDKIEFPFNDKMYFKQALGHIEKNEFEQALDKIEKVYANDKREAVNHLYVSVLYTLERYEEALDIAQKAKDFYINNEKNTILYTMLLIKNQLFLEAEVLIQQHLDGTVSAYEEKWENLEKELNLERELVNFEIDMQKKSTQKELFDIDSYSPMKQAKIVRKAHNLDLSFLQKIASKVFSSLTTTETVQRAFLEILIEKEDPKEYIFPWFNQQRKIIPKKLSVFEKVPIVRHMDELLAQKLEKAPSLVEVVKVEIINDLLLLYPFIEETVTNVDYWLDCYIAQFDFTNELDIHPFPKNEKQETMQTWINHLNQRAQRNIPPNE